MKDLLADFKALYGEEYCRYVINRAGRHSEYGSSPPKNGKARQLVYALLEVLDFQCNAYGDFEGMSDEAIKEFLLKHKDEVLGMEMEPPSYLGLACGVFGFLGKLEPGK